MLSDETIDNLVQPIVDRQVYINNYVIKLIAQRIKQIGALLPSDAYQLGQMLKQGGDVKKIVKLLADNTNLQVKQIRTLIRDVAKDAYADVKPYYDYREQPYIKFEDNEQLQKVVNAIANQTAETYVNLSKATAFMIRSGSTLKPTSIAKTYYSVIDKAVQAVQGGIEDYNSVMRKVISQLVESGIRKVSYDSESGRRYTQRLDTAVRRNLIDGVRAINQGVQEEVGKQFNADGKELSVHLDSAPDHEPIQGLQFTNEEYAKLNNNEPFTSYAAEGQTAKKFKPIKRAIGTWNCRHFAFSVILGVMKPNYSDKQLNQMRQENAKGHTFKNGKHLTKYQCTQYMRNIETRLRYAKEGQMAFKASGDMKMATKFQRKINNGLLEYQRFCKEVGMRMKYNRIFVDGYKPLKQEEYEY